MLKVTIQNDCGKRTFTAEKIERRGGGFITFKRSACHASIFPESWIVDILEV